MTHERDPRRAPAATSGPFPARTSDPAARNGVDADGAYGVVADGDFSGVHASDYDALADLFLGESESAASVPRSRPADAAGPPTRPAPGVPPSPSHRFAASPSHAEPSPPAEPVAPITAARIEGLIIGHLPVLASAWVTQYARHLAEQANAWVGLVKVRAGQVSVELVGPSAPDAPTAPAVSPPHPSLDAALTAGARMARHWLIRVDELAEARLADLTGLDTVTLLTGADEAAVVASYRTLKLLGEHADTDAPSRLGVAIMGASADTAQDAAARLARTVQVHLGVTLPLHACVPRIGAGRSVTLFRSELGGTGTDAALPGIVGAIRSADPSMAGEPPATAAARNEPTVESVMVSPRPAEPRVSAALTNPAATPSPVSRLVAPAWAETADAASPDTRREEPLSPARRAATSIAVPESLAAHLDGLRALPARCPIAPAVEIAIDAQGRVHLLADSAAANPGALEQLIAASGWAALNRDWVTLAAGLSDGAAQTAAAGPVLHMFTFDARNTRRVLDADVRVHLLVRMSVAGQDATVCRPLN